MNKSFKNEISKMFLLFIFYSFIGWVYEIAYETFLEHWTFMPREFFRGPICPIYGIGGLILFLLFRSLMEDKKVSDFIKLIIVFIVTFVVASLLELIMSYILEMTTGGWPWQSYVNYAFNFGGRVSLPTSIKFGFIGAIFIFFMYRPITSFLEMLERNKILTKVAMIVFIIFMIDTIFAYIIPTGVKLNVTRTKFI